MLQEFINANLIHVTEDVNLEKLYKSSDEIVKKLSKSREKIVSYTLAALDPSVSADNPDIVEVKEVITKFWSTFVSNVKDTPVTYIKAVILQALETIAVENNIAAVIYFSGVNSLRQFKLGKQVSVVKTFIERLGEKVVFEANRTWAVSIDIKNEKFSPELPGLVSEAFDKTEIEKNLKTIRNSLEKLSNETNAAKIHRHSLFLRSELLWWKESLYSTSLKKGYDELEKSVAPLVMAYDYSRLIPIVHPMSAEYFFRRSISEVIVKDSKYKIADLLKATKSEPGLKTLFSTYQIEKEKILLFNFIQGFSSEVYQAKDLSRLVGIAEDIEISLTEYALWILHDLQAKKVVSK